MYCVSITLPPVNTYNNNKEEVMNLGGKWRSGRSCAERRKARNDINTVLVHKIKQNILIKIMKINL